MGVKVYDSTSQAFVDATPKVRSVNAWTDGAGKVWNGNEWVDIWKNVSNLILYDSGIEYVPWTLYDFIYSTSGNSIPRSEVAYTGVVCDFTNYTNLNVSYQRTCDNYARKTRISHGTTLANDYGRYENDTTIEHKSGTYTDTIDISQVAGMNGVAIGTGDTWYRSYTWTYDLKKNATNMQIGWHYVNNTYYDILNITKVWLS